MFKQFLVKYSSELKTIFLGILLITIAFAYWWHILGNPIDELNLIFKAKTTEGVIYDAWEDFSDGDEGGGKWIHSYFYEYKISEGKKFKGIENGNGQILIDLPYPIKVEYLPDNPQVSRIKGSGVQNIFEFLWRKVGFGMLFLVICIAPGYILIRDAIRDIKKTNLKKNN